MIGSGGVLIAMMGALLGGLTWTLYDQEIRGGPVRFTGSPFSAALVYLLFVSILVFGVAALCGGVYQVRNGRRAAPSRGWVRFMLVLLGLAGGAIPILLVYE